MFDIEHPDITAIRATGYPLNYQPEEHWCEECGKNITDETIYEDGSHEFLCADCLLALHERW